MHQPLASQPVPPADIETIVVALADIRRRWRTVQRRCDSPGGRQFPARDELKTIVTGLAGALFPMRLGPADLRQEREDEFVAETLAAALTSLREQILLELAYSVRHAPEANRHPADWALEIVSSFSAELPQIRHALDIDIQTAYLSTPTARSVDEVLLFHPGVHAMIHYRLARSLHLRGAVLVAKIIAGIAHAETGVEIDPGAESAGLAHACLGSRVRVAKVTA